MHKRYYVHPNDLDTEPWQTDDPEDAAVVVVSVTRAEAAEALAEELAAALRDLTHEETCDHAWCIAGRAALEKYDAWKGKGADE